MPRLFACAVVRDDPPQVFAADDLETLNWVLALRLVAGTRSSDLPAGVRDQLREALLEERWGDAVELWISHVGVEVDVYPSMDFFAPDDVELAAIEMQFRPLFKD